MNDLKVIWAFIRQHWLVSGIGFIIIASSILLINSWVKNTTYSVTKEPDFIQKVVAELDRNVIGASYQSYFIIGPNDSAEHYMPIYVSGDSEVILYLIAEHHGTGELRKVDILIDKEKIDFDLGEKNELTKQIVLTGYLKESQKRGVHDFDKNFHVIWFRPIANQKTEDVLVVKALVNVLGLSQIIEIEGKQE